MNRDKSLVKIIFFGNERLASGVTSKCLTFESLLNEGYDVVAAVVNERSGSGRKKRQLEIAELAKIRDVPVVVYENKNQILRLISDTGAEVGVLAAFGRIISQEVIDAFSHGILNIHPSLLPKYRGTTPIESAILCGDKTTGVTLMQLVKEMDAGPTYGCAEIDSDDIKSKQETYEELSELGTELLLGTLEDIFSYEPQFSSIKQDDEQATFCQPIKKADGIVDWSKNAQRIAREVRAYLKWPGSRTSVGGKDLVLTEVLAIKNTPKDPPKWQEDNFSVVGKRLFAQCKDSSYIEILKLKPAGKKEMLASDFINGLVR